MLTGPLRNRNKNVFSDDNSPSGSNVRYRGLQTFVAPVTNDRVADEAAIRRRAAQRNLVDVCLVDKTDVIQVTNSLKALQILTSS